MWLERAGFQFRVVLNANEPGMLGYLEDFRQLAIRRQAGEQAARLLKRFDIARIHLIAVAVTLRDVERAIDLGDLAARLQARWIGAEAHRATLVGIGVAQDFLIALGPLFHQADQRRIGLGIILGRVRLVDAGHVARRLDDGHLHAIANAETRHLAFACKPCRPHLAMRAALSKATRQDDAMHAFQNVQRPGLIVEFFGIDQANVDLHLVGKAAMRQRFGNRFIGIRHIGIFADEADTDIAIRMVGRMRNLVPAGQIRLRRIINAEMGKDFLVQPFGMIGFRHVIDVAHVAGLDHAGQAHITEAGNLAFFVFRDRSVTAAQQDMWLDTNGAQLLHRVLCRLGLHLARRRNIWQQRQMDEAGTLRPEFLAKLTDRLEEWQAFNIADRSADFAQDELHILARIGQDEILDLVRDVRNHLNGRAEIVAAALFLDNVLVDAARRDVVRLAGRDAGEALIMAKVQIGLCAIIGDIDLTMLARAHRAGIDIEIRIELAQADLVATRLKQRTECGGSDTLAKGGHHAACNENIADHGITLMP